MAGRFSGPGQPYEGLVRKTSQGFKWTGEVRLIEKDLEAPLRWKKPCRVFVNSMSDLFHEAVPDAWIDRIFAVMALAPQHTFQILTKRPERMRAYFACSIDEGRRVVLTGARIQAAIWTHSASWPLSNVWLGVSCENQDTADERLPWLLKTPAAVRFVSAEPLLGSVDLTRLREPELSKIDDRMRFSALCKKARWSYYGHGLDWVIIGGESGPRARECDVAWIRSIVQQCHADGVAVFCKQLGTVWANAHHAHDTHGASMDDWPADLRIQDFPSVSGESVTSALSHL